MKHVLAILSFIILTFKLSFSQETASQFSDAIEDNSFFIEEAYNQETGIVQHISNGTYFKSPQEDFVFTFTQEWPLGSQAHQFSYTIPYVTLNSGKETGFGDVLLNYRYQLFSSESGIAFSPRVSCMLLSSNGINSSDYDFGLQLNLPFSKRVNEKFISHFNIGLTTYPVHWVSTIPEESYDVTRMLTSFNLGFSVIYLANAKYNFMLEVSDNIIAGFGNNAEVIYESELIINPGFRYAIDINSLQIVPGIGIPFRITENETNAGFFLYLSFEHPF